MVVLVLLLSMKELCLCDDDDDGVELYRLMEVERGIEVLVLLV